MTPLNAEARRKAFITFLLFFTGTAALLIIAIFFGVQVPFKQNEKLREQLAVAQKTKTFSEGFESRMDEMKRLMDSVNRPGVQAELVDGAITQKLTMMNTSISDSAATPKLYHDIVNAYADLQAAKKSVRDASSKDDVVKNSQAQIEDLKQQVMSLNQQLMTAKMSAITPQAQPH